MTDSTSDAEQLADESEGLALHIEAESLFRLAIPMMLGQVIGMLNWQISLILIGHIGALELGASAMARMWMGMSAYAILFGGQMSLDTLRSQAFGAKVSQPHLIRIVPTSSSPHPHLIILILTRS